MRFANATRHTSLGDIELAMSAPACGCCVAITRVASLRAGLPHVYLRLIFDAIGDHLEPNVLHISQCLSLLRDFEFRESLLRYSASNSSPTDFVDGWAWSIGKLPEPCTDCVGQNLGWGLSTPSSPWSPMPDHAQFARRT